MDEIDFVLCSQNREHGYKIFLEWNEEIKGLGRNKNFSLEENHNFEKKLCLMKKKL